MHSIKKSKGEIHPCLYKITNSKAKTLKEAHQCFHSESEDLSSLCLSNSVMYSRYIVHSLIPWAFSTADLYAGCLKG